MLGISRHRFTIVLSSALVMSTITTWLMGQASQSQNAHKAVQTFQPKPLSLPHLYWHFLIYQNQLDQKATELEAQGKDGKWLANDFQKRLRFTDNEFAIVRASSTRLAAEIKGLDAKAATIREMGASPWSHDELKSLTEQREADINATIAGLTQALPPQKKAQLDAFLVQFFAPKTAMKAPVPPSTQQSIPEVR